MVAWFSCERELRPLVPAAFELLAPRRAFLKVYELKFGAFGQPYLRPAFSQYRQVCVTVLAAPRGQEPMHVNLFMWEERGWSMQGGGGGASWNKKLADGRARIVPPPLNGFHFGGVAGGAVHALRLREPWLGDPWHGTGSLEFWPGPHEVPLRPGDWSASSLGRVEVEGCCLQDVSFLRDYRDVTAV